MPRKSGHFLFGRGLQNPALSADFLKPLDIYYEKPLDGVFIINILAIVKKRVGADVYTFRFTTLYHRHPSQKSLTLRYFFGQQSHGTKRSAQCPRSFIKDEFRRWKKKPILSLGYPHRIKK
jgi:hypothetical protein